MARKTNGNSLLKVILTDLAGVVCLILVPILGPLPGPGGIPLLLAGFGLFAVNHDWADDAIVYIQKHSQNARTVLFPDKLWIKRAWDAFAITLLVGGWITHAYSEFWLVQGLAIGAMAGSTTIFIMNRDRITWLEKALRKYGKR